MALLKLICGAALLSAVAHLTAAINCQYKNTTTGETFDLSALKKSEDYSYTDGSGPSFFFNICEDIHFNCNDTDVASCQREAGGKANNIGLLNTMDIKPLSLANPIDGAYGATLTYTTNNKCKSGTVRTTKIHIICDEQTDDPAVVQYGESPTCVYNFQLKTKLMCTGNGPSGGGGGLTGGEVFLIILFALLFIYIAGGFAYNMGVQKKDWKESFPNLDFWKEIPSLVKDGCVYSYKKSKKLFRRVAFGEINESEEGGLLG